MKNRSYLQYITIALALGLFAGCASYPIEKKFRREAATGLTVPMVQADAQKYINTVVIWGGLVVKVVNDSSGSRITVMETPLTRTGIRLMPPIRAGGSSPVLLCSSIPKYTIRAAGSRLPEK